MDPGVHNYIMKSCFFSSLLCTGFLCVGFDSSADSSHIVAFGNSKILCYQISNYLIKSFYFPGVPSEFQGSCSWAQRGSMWTGIGNAVCIERLPQSPAAQGGMASLKIAEGIPSGGEEAKVNLLLLPEGE